MPLYHFSEDPNIPIFEPRFSRLANADYVWAIDEWHAPMYYFPRDCPRACFWPGPQTTAEDHERWFGGIDAKMVIAVETAWLERIRSTKLYRYTLPDDGFELHDATAGHWVTPTPVTRSPSSRSATCSPRWRTRASSCASRPHSPISGPA